MTLTFHHLHFLHHRYLQENCNRIFFT